MINTVMKVFKHRGSLRPAVQFWGIYYLLTRSSHHSICGPRKAAKTVYFCKNYSSSESIPHSYYESFTADLISMASCVMRIGPDAFHETSNRQLGECILKYYGNLLVTETLLSFAIRFWSLFGFWDLLSLLLTVTGKSMSPYRAGPLHLTGTVSLHTNSFRRTSTSPYSLAIVFGERLHPKGCCYRITAISNSALLQYTRSVVRVCKAGLNTAPHLQLCLMHVSEALLFRLEVRGIGLSLLVDTMELFSGVYPCPMNERLLSMIQSVLIENNNYTMLTRDEISIVSKTMSLVSVRNLVLVELLSLRIYSHISDPDCTGFHMPTLDLTGELNVDPESKHLPMDICQMIPRSHSETKVSQRTLIALKDSYTDIPPELAHKLSFEALNIKSCEMTPFEIAELMSAIAHLPAGIECSLSLGRYITNYITEAHMCEMTLPQLTAVFAALACHLEASNLPCLPNRCLCIYDTSQIKPATLHSSQVEFSVGDNSEGTKIPINVPTYAINYHPHCLRVVTKPYRRLFPGGARAWLRRSKPKIAVLPRLVALNRANSPLRLSRKRRRTVEHGFFQDVLDVSRTGGLCRCHGHGSVSSTAVFIEAILSCIRVIIQALLHCFDSLGIYHPVTDCISEGCLPERMAQKEAIKQHTSRCLLHTGDRRTWRSTPRITVVQSTQDFIIGLQLLVLNGPLQPTRSKNTNYSFNPKEAIDVMGVQDLENLILILETISSLSGRSVRMVPLRGAIQTDIPFIQCSTGRRNRELSAQIIATLRRHLGGSGSKPSRYKMSTHSKIYNFDVTIILETDAEGAIPLIGVASHS